LVVMPRETFRRPLQASGFIGSAKVPGARAGLGDLYFGFGHSRKVREPGLVERHPRFWMNTSC